jgi:hypothetical protein
VIYRWYDLIRTCAGECDWLFHWWHKLCAAFCVNVNINYRLPSKVFYRICTLRHIRIEINHGSQNVFWVLTWVGQRGIKFTNIRKPMLKLKTHSGFHDLFLKQDKGNLIMHIHELVWCSITHDLFSIFGCKSWYTVYSIPTHFPGPLVCRIIQIPLYYDYWGFLWFPDWSFTMFTEIFLRIELFWCSSYNRTGYQLEKTV